MDTMAWYAWYGYSTPSKKIEQNIEEPRYITKGIKEVEELKENLGDLMPKIYEGLLSEILENF